MAEKTGESVVLALNLLIIVVVILACSYLVRCIARLFQQTFQSEDYEWKKVFSAF